YNEFSISLSSSFDRSPKYVASPILDNIKSSNYLKCIYALPFLIAMSLNFLVPSLLANPFI
ncbi:MAG: hypothetical protein ACJ71P_20330, partial [Nitrososphaeraceae archaeon]